MRSTAQNHRIFAWGTAACITVSLILGGCERDARPAPESDLRQDQITLFNATHDILPLQRQSLHPNYVVDCGLVALEPSRFLSTEHLSSTVETRLFSGIETSLAPNRENAEGGQDTSSRCHFSFVSTDDDRLSPIATAWPRDLSDKTFYSDVDAPPDVDPEPRTLIAEADYSEAADSDIRPWRDRPCQGDWERCSDAARADLLTAPRGAQYHWSAIGDFPVLRTWNPIDLSETPVADPSPECTTGRLNTPLTWDTPPSGRWRVTDVSEVTKDLANGNQNQPSDQGLTNLWDCHDVELREGQSSRSWQFCGSRRIADAIESPHKRGDVFVEFFEESQSSSPPAAYEALTIEVDRRTESGVVFETESIEAIVGYGIPEHIGLDWNARARQECEPRREVPDCHQIVLPAHLEIETSGGTIDIPPGYADFLTPETHRRLELIRGIYRVVSDLRCTDERTGPSGLSHPGPYMELVYFGGITQVLD